MKCIKYIVIIFCVALTSCVTPRKTHYLQEPSKSIADYPEVYTPADYQIQKSDELDIKVTTLDPESKKIFNGSSSSSGSGSTNVVTTNQKDLYTYTVYDVGTIDFPYIGAIEVAGLTTREARCCTPQVERVGDGDGAVEIVFAQRDDGREVLHQVA